MVNITPSRADPSIDQDTLRDLGRSIPDEKEYPTAANAQNDTENNYYHHQIENLTVELTALQLFVKEQLYIKQLTEAKTATPNNCKTTCNCYSVDHKYKTPPIFLEDNVKPNKNLDQIKKQQNKTVTEKIESDKTNEENQMSDSRLENNIKKEKKKNNEIKRKASDKKEKNNVNDIIKEKQETVYILGDSMVKKLNGYLLTKNGDGNGGIILVFIREDIPSKLVESQMKTEGFFIELNLRRKKWLLCCSYNPKYSQISHHLKEIGKDLDVLTSKYENIVLMGDFNAEPTDTALSDFCEIYNYKQAKKFSKFYGY